MTEYFKLVRPDFKSFYDENFQWPVKGIVEVADAAENGPCGKGLHLARTVESGLKYAKFPFRILKVIPQSPVLGEDNDKIRVAKAESLGELPVPQWAANLEKKIETIKEEVKVIPWFKGVDTEKAEKLVRVHFKLLVPFGFKMKFDVEILNKWDAAWAAAGDAAGDAAWDAAGDAARAAAWDAAWDAAGDAARAAAWDAARDAAWDAARDAARDAAWDAAWDAARAAAWDAAGDLLKHENPFSPLWEVHKLGFWPIGFNGHKFILFSEKAESKGSAK